MLLGFAFASSVLVAGFGVLALVGLAKGPVALGLAGPAGLAVLAIVSTWCVLVGTPPPVAGLAFLLLPLLGLALAIRDRQSVAAAVRTLIARERVALALLGASTAIPVVVMAVAFGGTQAPLSPHDGAFHTQVIQAYRAGANPISWYPPGLGALFAAPLQLTPWVDSAQGAMDLGMGLALLAGPTLFGLGVAIWGDLRMAAAAAISLGLTYLFPLFPQLWSGWPLTASLILTLGVWTIALQYVQSPSTRWAVLGGLALAAIVLAHATELYSLAIVLLVLAGSARRKLRWGELPWALLVAAVVAFVCAAPYFPSLLNWVGGGGAYAVGIEDSQVPTPSGASSATTRFLVFVLDALGLDLPLRVLLILVGGVWATRARTGRGTVAIALVFAALAALFGLGRDLPVVPQVFAVLFPWALDYRLLMLDAVTQALLAGVGGVLVVTSLDAWLVSRYGRRARLARLSRRALRLLVVTWLVVATWAMVVFMDYPAGQVTGFVPDDAAAMAWLRAHAPPGSVVVNDTYADAGIWIPYKAGLPIVLPRILLTDDLAQRTLLIENIARLNEVPEARAEACALNVAYVYRGAKTSSWQDRAFPSVDVMRGSPVLEEVFSSGEAVVFRTRFACAR